MNKRIFRSYWVVALPVFLISAVIILAVMMGHADHLLKARMADEMRHAARGVTLSGEAYLQGAAGDECRITHIAADGTVLFESEPDTAEDDPLACEEVAAARRDGTGQASRYADALAARQYFLAQRLPDGSVLRLAAPQATLWRLLANMAMPISLMLVTALVFSFFLASRLTKRLFEPVNAIDPADSLPYMKDEEFAEVLPLLRRLNNQQAQIQADKAELEKTSLIRQEFTANASHELKTPLHAISGYAELIENGMVGEQDIKPFAQKIRMESQRLSKIVEDIIELSKLDSGGIGMPREEVDLYAVAESVLEALAPAAEKGNVRLRLVGQHCTVNGVSQVLYSIVYNLCDNAVKYNRPGGTVAVQIEEVGNRVQLAVSDNGIGIPKEHQSRLFERFYRVDKSHSKEVGGTGLGLSIVKHAVRMHGATIAVHSVPDEGSVFTVTFPK